jgi:hypothetical protein
LLVFGAASAGAAPPVSCTGDLSNPPASLGLLSGTYQGNVEVSGACAVFAGPTEIKGNLTLLPGSTLVAAFGTTNFVPGTPASSLTVDGNLMVKSGATLIAGCFPTSFPCIDDPFSGPDGSPTLSSPVTVGGNLMSSQPLGVVVHDGSIRGNVMESGGGGGVSCDPPWPGAFGVFGSPVYSDYEDSVVGGNLSVSSLNSCWLGVARVKVGGNMIINSNQLADPDAIEIVSNNITGNLICQSNSPMLWDSGDPTNNLYPRIWQPNTVGGNRIGQCVIAPAIDMPGGVSPGPF